MCVKWLNSLQAWASWLKKNRGAKGGIFKWVVFEKFSNIYTQTTYVKECKQATPKNIE